MFVTSKRFILLFLAILSLLLLFSLSNLSAASYNLNDSNDTYDIQNIIDNDYDDELTINLDDGNYAFSQININRNAIIQGKNQNRVIINSISPILFNVRAENVIIRNLTIINDNEYGIGIQSSVAFLTISNCNITTRGESIFITPTIRDSEFRGYRINTAADDAAGLAIRNHGFILIENNIISSLGEGTGFAIWIDFNRDISSENLQESESRAYRINTAADAVANGYSVYIIGNTISSANSGVYLALPSISENLREAESRIRDADMSDESNSRGLDQASRNVEDVSNSFLVLENNKVIINGAGFWLTVDNANITNNTIIGNWYNEYNSIGIAMNPKSNFNFNVIGNNITNCLIGITTVLFDDLSGNFLINSNNIEAFIGINPIFHYYVLQVLDRIDTINTAIGNSINLTVNYNRIVTVTHGRTLSDVWIQIGANSMEGIQTDLIGYGIMLQGNYHSVNSNFDYNWWGTNDITGNFIGFYIDYEIIDQENNNKVMVDENIMPNNHYILSITNLTSLANVFVGDKLDFALLVLNDTLTNEGVENLPNFVIEGTINDLINYITNKDDGFVYQITVSDEGLQSIDASLDDAYDRLEFYASKHNVSITDEISNGTIIDNVDSEKDNKSKIIISNNTNNASKRNNVDNTDDVDNTSNADMDKESNSDSNNNLVASAAMKDTGIPIIAVLLILLSALGVCFTRKRN